MPTTTISMTAIENNICLMHCSTTCLFRAHLLFEIRTLTTHVMKRRNDEEEDNKKIISLA